VKTIASTTTRRRNGSLQADLVSALGLAALVVIPLGYGFLNHQRLVRNEAIHAVVLTLLDGEMEVLAAGELRSFNPGTHPYPLRGVAADRLPPGHCSLIRTTLPDQATSLTLEWQPTNGSTLHSVTRTLVLPPQP